MSWPPHATGRLPDLLELDDLHGDLHMHTDWSDGRTRSRPWLRLRTALGRRYVAICDHAKRLKDGRLERQAEEIAALSERLDGFEILTGVEVDIRRDGSLDMSDEVLAERDWVMASIHAGLPVRPR